MLLETPVSTPPVEGAAVAAGVGLGLELGGGEALVEVGGAVVGVEPALLEPLLEDPLLTVVPLPADGAP